MTPSYDAALVLTSYVIAALGAYASLALYARACARPGISLWTLSSAVALAAGVWTMHFLGMLALEVPVELRYRVDLTLISILPVVAASFFVFSLLDRRELRRRHPLLAACALAAGIGVMHYLGMASIQIAPGLIYRADAVAASLGAAFAFAYVAVSLIAKERDQYSLRRRLVVSLLLGLAVTAMHYLSMQGTQFAANSVCIAPGAGIGSDGIEHLILGVVVIGLMAGMALAATDAKVSRKLRLTAEALAVANVALEERTRRAERLMAQARLAQQQFFGAFEHAPIGMALVSTDGRILRVNKALCAMLGYPEQDLMGITFHQITHPEDLDRDVRNLESVLAGKYDHYEMEKRYLASGGRTIWATLSVSIVRDEADRPLHFISQVQDITARKESELELARQKDFLDAVIEAVPAIVGAKDEQGRFLLANQACCDIIGRPREEVLGRTDVELSNKPQALRAMAQDREVLATLGDRQWTDEWITPDGVQHWLLKHKRGVRQPDGRRYLVSASLDVTEKHALQLQLENQLEQRRLIEEELRTHRDRLQELVAIRTCALEAERDRAEMANRSKSEFLMNMSHELRTPMHAVMSFAELGKTRMLGNKPDAGKMVIYFERILASSQRLLRLLNDLLDIAKMESGKMTYHFVPVCVHAVLLRAMSEFEGMAKSKGLDLRLEQGATCDRISGDFGRVVQVFSNLLSNAIKFSGTDGTITLQTRDSAMPGNGTPAIEVRVMDRGPGVGVDEVERIFEKFEQGSATKTGAGGTGLGLAICRNIVTDHGGRSWVEPREEGGSQFCVLLPSMLGGGNPHAVEPDASVLDPCEKDPAGADRSCPRCSVY